jgi:hypothetical protein
MVEEARRTLAPSASNFLGHADGSTGALGEEKGEETHDTSSQRRLVQRREGDDVEHFVDRRRVSAEIE